jgi:hypothetical protein
VQAEIALSGVIGALSYALDITEGQPAGHAVRSCMIGMRIAEELGLPARTRADLFYGLLLKDAGCSANAERMAALFGAGDQAANRTWTGAAVGGVRVRLAAPCPLRRRERRALRGCTEGGRRHPRRRVSTYPCDRRISRHSMN